MDERDLLRIGRDLDISAQDIKLIAAERANQLSTTNGDDKISIIT